jgi:hypothetical protein
MVQQETPATGCQHRGSGGGRTAPPKGACCCARGAGGARNGVGAGPIGRYRRRRGPRGRAGPAAGSRTRAPGAPAPPHPRAATIAAHQLYHPARDAWGSSRRAVPLIRRRRRGVLAWPTGGAGGAAGSGRGGRVGEDNET